MTRHFVPTTWDSMEGLEDVKSLLRTRTNMSIEHDHKPMMPITENEPSVHREMFAAVGRNRTFSSFSEGGQALATEIPKRRNRERALTMCNIKDLDPSYMSSDSGYVDNSWMSRSFNEDAAPPSHSWYEGYAEKNPSDDDDGYHEAHLSPSMGYMENDPYQNLYHRQMNFDAWMRPDLRRAQSYDMPQSWNDQFNIPYSSMMRMPPPRPAMNDAMYMDSMAMASLPPMDRKKMAPIPTSNGKPKALRQVQTPNGPFTVPPGHSVAPPRRKERRKRTDNKYTCRFIVPDEIAKDRNFRVTSFLIGKGGHNMKQISEMTKAKLRVRGQFSGHLEGPRMQESEDPLQLCISAPDQQAFNQARTMVHNLFLKLFKEFADMRGSKTKFEVQCSEP